MREMEAAVKFTVEPVPVQTDTSLSCQAVRQGVHSRWLHGSIRMSLLFSAQILHSWKVEPISQ